MVRGRRSTVALIVGLAVASTLAGCGNDNDPAQAASELATAAATAAADARVFELLLNGDEVVEGEGDGDGTGRATVTLEPGRGEVCYVIVVEGVDVVESTHLHRGPDGGSGEVVLSLQPPVGGMVERCVPADAGLLRRLAVAPSDYYVHIHTQSRPKGALRGQLAPQG